ncbi:MAG: 2-C-methyl-D-erythritol 4-phosphate cytidylyltransferase [Clostridia bacterium]|nr:2-C-methyl-D-erythritol 4-phosphate cytidylyltransferase [Clostridia bacterium]
MKKTFLRRLSGLSRLLLLRQRPHTTAVILAGGSGLRMGDTGGTAKQWLTLGGKTVLERAIDAFERCPHIDEIVVVVRRGEGQKTAELLTAAGVRKVRTIVSGGKTRQASAYNGARRVSSQTRYIAIHDAARCLVSPKDISATVLAAYAERAASLGVPVTDTVKRVNKDRYVLETRDRSELWLAATPQVFAYPMYLAAATEAKKLSRAVTDDNMLIEALGQRIRMVEAHSPVFKITKEGDLDIAAAMLAVSTPRKEAP